MIVFQPWADTRTVVATCLACPQRDAAAAPPNPEHLSTTVQALVSNLRAHGCTHPTVYEVHTQRMTQPPQNTTYPTIIRYE